MLTNIHTLQKPPKAFLRKIFFYMHINFNFPIQCLTICNDEVYVANFILFQKRRGTIFYDTMRYYLYKQASKHCQF